LRFLKKRKKRKKRRRDRQRSRFSSARRIEGLEDTGAHPAAIKFRALLRKSKKGERRTGKEEV